MTDSAVPETIRQQLAPKGYRIALDEPTPSIEIWYRKEALAQPKTASATAVYDRLAPSALIGVLHFIRPSSDYRGQSIPAGFYTLRPELMPDDGNHLGVAPSRDFLLLVPPSADPGPETTPNFLDVVELSRKASGTKHPAPLSLVPAEGGATAAVTKDDEGHSIFTTTIHLSSGEDLPIALVVKGTAPQ
ncbi:MAG TPA: hypothetical protein VLL05_07495 [Terriglobales bacterium]|nr:hypothetical protein [Terriglobales bacterium]